jgi:hypothetical protein
LDERIEICEVIAEKFNFALGSQAYPIGHFARDALVVVEHRDAHVAS